MSVGESIWIAMVSLDKILSHSRKPRGETLYQSVKPWKPPTLISPLTDTLENPVNLSTPVKLPLEL